MKTFKTLAAITTLSVITMSHEMMEKRMDMMQQMMKMMMERTAAVNPAK